MPLQTSSAPVRFGDFVLDPSAYELRRHGRPLKVERRPMELLLLLVERPGELVTRDEIVARLWGRDVFIDVDTSINTVIRKVRRALGDAPDRPRFIQTVQGKGYRFVAAIERPDAPTVLAVLGFDNHQTDRDRDYVADGLTEETIANLARIDPERLRVIGRTTSLAYRGTARTIREIGRDLGAGFVVEGSVRGGGGRVRVTATLISAADQVQIWTNTYDRDADDLLGLQAELGGEIAQQIYGRLASPRGAAPPRPQTAHREAYDLYLRGRYYYNQMTPATTTRALECFRRASALDPEFAQAWAGLADAYSSRLFNSDTKASDVDGDARAAAEQAMRTGADAAEALTAVARVRFLFDWDWRGAERLLRQAIALNPSSAQSHWMLAHALSHQGRHDEALAASARAREVEPLDALTQTMSAQIAYTAGRMESAVAHAQEALALEPDFWVAHWQQGQAYAQLQRYDRAASAIAEAVRLSNGNSKPMAVSAYLLALVGRTDDARRAIAALEERARAAYVPPVALALAWSGLRDDRRVFEHLDDALRVRDVHLIYLPWDPTWDWLRQDRRFSAVLTKVKR